MNDQSALVGGNVAGLGSDSDAALALTEPVSHPRGRVYSASVALVVAGSFAVLAFVKMTEQNQRIEPGALQGISGLSGDEEKPKQYLALPMRFPPGIRGYECHAKTNDNEEDWCQSTCSDMGGTIWGCVNELDCEGLPECEGLPLPARGDSPCICTANGPQEPTQEPTPSPPTPTSPPSPTPPPSPAPPMPDVALGGWCAAKEHFKCGDVWPSVDIILPGGFQPDPSVLPGKGNWQQGIPAFLTMGGAGVGIAGQDPCLQPEVLEKAARDLGVTGIAYDAEGCYYGMQDSDKLKNVVKKIRDINPDLKHMLVPVGDLGDVGGLFGDDGTFDYFAPMLYWGLGSYNDIDWAKVDKWRKDWKKQGWKASKTFLTFQSKSAYEDAHGREVLENLGKTAKAEGYRGVLGWFSPSKSVNEANLKTIRDAMNR